MSSPTLATWSHEHRLAFRPTSFALPQATQLLRHGFMRDVSGVARGDLPGELKDAWIAHVAYVYEGVNDLKRRPFTLVLIQAPESLSFADRILCHDRDLSDLDMSNPESDREVMATADRSIRLESDQFLARYALFADSEQNENSVWRLFAPSLIDWLTHAAPVDFSFELQDGALCCFVPGTIDEPDALDQLCLAASRVLKEVARIGQGAGRSEAAAPGSHGKVEARLAEHPFTSPPDSVKKAAKPFKRGPFIGDEAWKLGAEAFFRCQAVAAGFRPISTSSFRASHIETILPGELAQVAEGTAEGPWQNSFLVFTDSAEYDTQGWSILVADGRSFIPGQGAMPTGVSAERGLTKVSMDGRSLIFSTLDGGVRDRNAKELNAFLTDCGSSLGAN